MAGFELYAPRLKTHRRTWTAFVIILCIVFNILAGIIALIPYFFQVAQYMAAHPGAAMELAPKPDLNGLWFLIAPCAIEILLVLGWMALVEKRPPAVMGFNGNGFVRFIRGYLIGCAMLVFVVGTIWGLGGYRVENAGIWVAPTVAAFLPILGYLVGFVIQGSSEEVLMRGWLMQTVASRHGLVWGIIINSLLFGAAHLGNIKPSPAMYAGCTNVALFGVFISLYACRDRSLWGVCGWHGAWNWLLGIGFGLEVSGLHMGVKPLIIDLGDTAGAAWWLTGAEWGPEASIVTTLMLLAGIIILIWKGALKPGESYAVPAPDAAT